MKYKIEKNTVQETLIIPLYARKVCSQLYPNLYRDETAVSLINEIDYDFSEAEKNSRRLMQRFGSLEVAMRQNDLAFEVKDYLKIHPNAGRLRESEINFVFCERVLYVGTAPEQKTKSAKSGLNIMFKPLFCQCSF